MSRAAQVTDVVDAEQVLRDAHLRVTRQRLAVLEAVHAHPHTDTDAVIRLVRDAVGEVSKQAVYDVLRVLTEAGVVRRIQPAGSVARYELRVGDNHHHVVCRMCGGVADVDCAVDETPCLTASDDHGYAIDEAEVVYWGVCPTCAASQSPTTSGRRRPGRPAHSPTTVPTSPTTTGRARTRTA